MNHVSRRTRKVAAVLAGLAVAATISVVAPATATAQQAGKARHAPSGVVQLHDTPTKGGGATANDWTW